MKNESSVDTNRVQRLAKNVAELLIEQAKVMDAFTRKSRPTRLRILSDIKGLLQSLPLKDRGCIPKMVFQEVERILKDRDTIKSMGTSLEKKALAKHTIKVDGEGNCLGSPGAGVKVIIDDISVGACVTGTLSGGPTGGGVSVGHSY